MFLKVVLPFSSRFWLLAFCFGCFCAEEKTSADSRLGFLLSIREMKMRLPWNFWVTMPPPEFARQFHFLAPPVSSTSGLVNRIS